MARERKIHMLSPRERLLALRAFPALADLPLDDLGTLAQLTKERTYSGGEYILRANEPVEEALMMMSGSVELRRDDYPLELIRAPMGIGLIGILADFGGPPGDIVAKEDVMGLALPAESMMRLYERNFRFIRNDLAIATRVVLDVRRGLPFDPRNPPRCDIGTRPPEGSLDFVECLLWLSDMVWQNANLEAVAELCRAGTQREYNKGDVLWEQGDHAAHYVSPLYGIIACERTAEDGEILSGKLGTRYILGLFEGLASRPRPYTARAETDLVLIEWSHDALLAVLEDHYDMAMVLLENVSRQAAELFWTAVNESMTTDIIRSQFPTAIARQPIGQGTP